MRNLSSVRAWLRERPWIWIVLLLVLFFLADMVFVKIALSVAPEVIG